MHPLLLILFNFITGITYLMFGVNQMSTGLEKANTVVMKKVLSLFTRNVFTSFAAGTFFTALVQSSTAITVITVGLVNSGVVSFSHAVGIIFGANIGTTLTAQLMSFRITQIAWPVIILSLTIRMISRRKTVKNLAGAAMGFGFMFLGLQIMNSSVPFIKNNAATYEIFQIFGKYPLLGILVGMITTLLVQSSSATVGVTIVLFNAGLIGFEAAIGLMLGDNIGTCITAQFASIGSNIHARRTAWAHTLYNVIGVLAALIFFQPFSRLINQATQLLGQDTTRLIANAHTLFNIISAVIFLPITKYYVRFIEWLIKEKPERTLTFAQMRKYKRFY